MQGSLRKIIQGYVAFRDKYAHGDHSVMRHLSNYGQKPEIMMVACCDSRVDPALILQCDPGDLFVARNVANIIPPFEKDLGYHGTSAALEFGICHLNVQHLIILGHSQCGGIQALINQPPLVENDFITKWVSLIKKENITVENSDSGDSSDNYAKFALMHSYQNCLTFPWIKQRVEEKKLSIHLWFFNIKEGEMLTYCHHHGKYHKLDSADQFV